MRQTIGKLIFKADDPGTPYYVICHCSSCKLPQAISEKTLLYEMSFTEANAKILCYMIGKCQRCGVKQIVSQENLNSLRRLTYLSVSIVRPTPWYKRVPDFFTRLRKARIVLPEEAIEVTKNT